jgi:hypothetical protein
MGEEIDLSTMALKPVPQDIPKIKKGDFEVVYGQVLALIRKGYKHRDISKSLRVLGFTYIDIEKMLSRADAEIYDSTHKQVDYKIVGLVAAAIILIVGVIVIVGGVTVSGAKDCGDDTLCSQKILYCTEGFYQSSFAGNTYNYDVRRELGSCRVIKTVVSSTILNESPGMSMTCNYPFSNGIIDNSDEYGSCSGNLVNVHT